MKAIAMFNNKGGVGKTTLLCNLAAYIQKQLYKNVLVIDADPQCNTSTYVLDDDQFEKVYENLGNENKVFTIADLADPLVDGQGYIEDFKVLKSQNFDFDMIPGDPRFATYEDFLAGEWKDVKSNELRGIRSTMLFIHFIGQCQKYDYVFFDMGPSLGAINRSVLLACDYFITPMSADVFSLLALDNIGKSLSEWKKLFNEGVDGLPLDKKSKISNLKKVCDIKFLGYVEQQYIMKTVDSKKRAVRAYEKILSRIPKEMKEKVILPINDEVKKDYDYKIGSIPNFYSLIPMSQTVHKPIFDLVNTDGVVGAHYQKVKDYESVIASVADSIFMNMEVMM